MLGAATLICVETAFPYKYKLHHFNFRMSCATKVRHIIRLLLRSEILLDSLPDELFVGVSMLLKNNQCSPQ